MISEWAQVLYGYRHINHVLLSLSTSKSVGCQVGDDGEEKFHGNY